MAKPKKDNRVKRKRGKKFAFHGDAKEANELEKRAKTENVNPFEQHSKSKKVIKDIEVRKELI
mgnify:FL=1|jgi:hypothetical protein